MKNFITIQIIILGILVLSCSSSKTAYLSEEYDKIKINNSNLLVIINFDGVTIENENDIKDDLGADSSNAKKIYEEYFRLNLVYNLKSLSSFKEIKIVNKNEIGGFVNKEFIIGNSNKLIIDVPTKIISFDKFKTDFLLVIDSLVAASPEGPGVQSSVDLLSMGTNTPGIITTMGPSDRLAQILNFVFLDNRDNKIIGYGRAIGESNVPFGMTRVNWEESIKRLTHNILMYSPFPVKSEEINKLQ